MNFILYMAIGILGGLILKTFFTGISLLIALICWSIITLEIAEIAEKLKE